MKTETNSNACSGCSAATCSACDGCQWQREGEPGNWCYMFEHRPQMLPCTQHDKFKETRDMISAVVRKRPEILTMMVMAYSEPNTLPTDRR